MPFKRKRYIEIITPLVKNGTETAFVIQQDKHFVNNVYKAIKYNKNTSDKKGE